MKYRWFKGSIILAVFFSVDWIASDVPYVFVYQEGIIDLKELLFNWSDDTSGYQSLIEYGLIYIIPFILFLNFVIRRDIVVSITRRKNRQAVLRSDLKKMIAAATIFCLIHEVIALLMTYILIPMAILIETNWFQSEIIHTIVLIFFYINIAILYRIFSLILDSKKGLALIFVLCVAEFYYTTIRPAMEFGLFEWQPYCDVVLLYRLLNNEISWIGIILIVFRQIAFILILLIIENSLFFRKDILEFEVFT